MFWQRNSLLILATIATLTILAVVISGAIVLAVM